MGTWRKFGLAVLFVLTLASCTGRAATQPTPKPYQTKYLTHSEALRIARQFDRGAEQWRVTFIESFEDTSDPEPSIDKSRGAVWIAEGIHRLGNKTVVYIDAVTGEPFRVMQVESPRSP